MVLAEFGEAIIWHLVLPRWAKRRSIHTLDEHLSGKQAHLPNDHGTRYVEYVVQGNGVYSSPSMDFGTPEELLVIRLFPV